MGELEEARKTAREYPFTTTIFGGTPFPDLVGPAVLDAANECEHGWLGTDPKEKRQASGCKCWEPKPATPVARKRVYQLDLPPFIEKVVHEIDAEEARLRGELERLHAVRSALTEPE